jgi:ATP-binding cassette subfamily C protein LapB
MTALSSAGTFVAALPVSGPPEGAVVGSLLVPIKEPQSPYQACLSPLLEALQWRGTSWQMASAMPTSNRLNTLLALRSVLARLGFSSTPSATPLGGLSLGDLPCVFVPRVGSLSCWVVLASNPNGLLTIFCGERNEIRHIDPSDHQGDVYAVVAVDPADEASARKHGWIRYAVSREAKIIRKLFLLTFAINLLALLLSIYVMTVYNWAVFAHSNMTLAYLFAGITLCLALEFVLREARTRALAYLGARMESLITVSAFQRLLHMPAGVLEPASLTSQISRLKMFESVRDAFSGPLASTLLDLPFIVLFIALVFIIGGQTGWIIVAFALLMAGMVIVLGPIIRLMNLRVGQANTERRRFLAELTEQIEAIRNCRVEDIWLERNRDLSAAQLKAQSDLQRLNFTEQTISNALFVLTGTAVVFCGAIQVMAGTVSPGALVALMALVWRVLTPVQTMFLNIDRLGQTREVFRQVDQLMRLPVEYEPNKHSLLPRKFGGQLAAEGVVFRYPNHPEPTLRGVTVEVAARTCVVLAGGTGSGKSTLLKLFAGLYPVQAGAIYVDGLDLRQVDARDLRHSIGFLEEKPHVFSGTLAENIRLTNLEASDVDVLAALIEFRVLPPDATLGDIHASIATVTSDSLLRRFALTRVFARQVPIYLLDEPSLYLDAESDAAVRSKIERLKGHATILMATVQPAYMRLADRVVLMRGGRVWAEGGPDSTIPLLMQQARSVTAEARVAALLPRNVHPLSKSQ